MGVVRSSCSDGDALTADVGELQSTRSTRLLTGDAVTRMYLLSSPPEPQ